MRILDSKDEKDKTLIENSPDIREFWDIESRKTFEDISSGFDRLGIKYKFNRFTPGSNIRIISEDKLKKMRPDYLLVLPWHFKDFIIKKEKKFLSNGGKLIFPLPDIEII